MAGLDSSENLKVANSSPNSSLVSPRRKPRPVCLSARATAGGDPGPLVERVSILWKDTFHPESNPTGIISLGIAENLLSSKEILEFAKQAIAENLVASDLTYGDNMWGSKRLGIAMSSFLNTYFHPAVQVEANQMIYGAGVTGLLDHLFHTIVDQDDGVLVLTPYYAGFDRELVGGRSAIRIVPVHWEGIYAGHDVWDGPSGLKAAFEQALQQAESQGIQVRALIICNPHNPLGVTVSRETLLGYCRFAEEHNLHLVSDEIYAMSVYKNQRMQNHTAFTSILNINLDEEMESGFDKRRVHVLYGMSKDFCANGFRVGTLVTQHNPDLITTLALLHLQTKISSPADVAFATLLTSDYLPTFLEINVKRLAEAQAQATRWFERRGVTVKPSNAGHFIWLDLGSRVGIRSFSEELEVYQRLLDGRVYLAPGSAYHCHTPGWFRLTFSVSPSVLEMGLKRIERLLGLAVQQESR